MKKKEKRRKRKRIVRPLEMSLQKFEKDRQNDRQTEIQTQIENKKNCIRRGKRMKFLRDSVTHTNDTNK